MTDNGAGAVVLDHGTFEANVVADIFDERDLEFQPRLQPLPPELECRPEDRYVMTQVGNSCTGHAVAAMINAVVGAQAVTGEEPLHASPYMLYALARRYDEFEGEADSGSSLRAALKGWYYHGVLPDSGWPALDTSPEPDIDKDPGVAAAAARCPLGAFYRVNTARLDDLQSAVAELSAVVVSAAIHDGWNNPVLVSRTGQAGVRTMHVINRTDSSKAVGGHAFCVVGYNEVGFLVQNSWGRQWGKNGFATLPYDDWLESGYDAWVARPGVPSVVSERTRRKILATAAGNVVDAPGPDLQRLSDHVVNIGNNGRLSKSGRFTSSRSQIDRIFRRMAERHSEWPKGPRRIVLYAHGGLNSERAGLDVAQRQLNWWLRNEIYPVTFAWQSGLTETIENQVSDLVGPRLPAGGWSFNLIEQADRLVENLVRARLRWTWAEMKENATAATSVLPEGHESLPDDDLPGASLTVDRLRSYLEGTDPRPEVHLVGHSAGAIFLVGVLDRLVDAGITVSSLSYLAGALRIDEWMERVLPHLESGAVSHFTAFGMNPGLELDDSLRASRLTAYNKSLLYLVSRAFEVPEPGRSEVPLVGMAHFARTDVGGRTYADAVKSVGGTVVWSPSGDPPDARSESTTHGGFDDDGPTMTSVILRIVGEAAVTPQRKYAPHLPPPAVSATGVTEPTGIDDQPPEAVVVDVNVEPTAPGPASLGGALPAEPATPVTATSTGYAPSSTASRSRVMRALEELGWSTDAHESEGTTDDD